MAASANELTAVGDAGQIPFDVSPIQIGTQLTIDGARGEIVGRERWSWDDGFWNEWLLQFPENSTTWIAEEAGLYLVREQIEPTYEELALLKGIARAGNAALGQSVEIGGQDFTVSDIKLIRCIASEGAQIQPIEANSDRQSVDLRNSSQFGLSWQNHQGAGTLWGGRNFRLEDLEPARLRQFEGWSKPNFESAS